MRLLSEEIVQSNNRWSKERIEQELFNYPSLLDSIVIDNDYQMSFDTKIMFNFADCPLKSEYKTVVFDQEQGIVVTGATTKELTRDLAKRKYFDFSHSRVGEEMLGVTEHHALCFGSYCFVALDTYLKRNTDWVALHWMTSMAFDQDETVFVDEVGNEFLFSQKYRKVKDATYSTVSVNYLLQQEDEDNIGMLDLSDDVPELSIMNDADYLAGSIFTMEIKPREIAERLLQKEVDTFSQCMNSELEMELDNVSRGIVVDRMKTYKFNW